ASPDGKRLAFVQPGAVAVWDHTAGKLRRSEFRPDLRAAPLAFSLDGKTLATGDESTVLLWDVEQMPEAADPKKETAGPPPHAAPGCARRPLLLYWLVSPQPFGAVTWRSIRSRANPPRPNC